MSKSGRPSEVIGTSGSSENLIHHTGDECPDSGGVQTVMVPVAIEMLRYLSRDWSESVQIRIETDDDGKHTMVLRPGATATARTACDPCEMAQYMQVLSAQGTADRIALEATRGLLREWLDICGAMGMGRPAQITQATIDMLGIADQR